jgi:hypothetical protein
MSAARDGHEACEARARAGAPDDERAGRYTVAPMPRRLLIHPPFADPTQPYVSLPTLKGYLGAKGLDVELLDLNLEAAHHLLSREGLERLARRLTELCHELNGRSRLDFDAQRRYRLAFEARDRVAAAADADPSPLEVFRDRARFLDPVAYEIARLHVDAAFDGLAALHFPYRYGFNSATHSVVPWSFDLLAEHAQDESGVLVDLYDRVFEGGLAGVDFIGLSIAFPSQIPEASKLAYRLRRLAADAFIAFGGPAIHQVLIHADDAARQRVLEHVDGVGLFEGEETLAQLLPLLPEWQARRDPDVLALVPNLLMRDVAGRPRLGPRHVLDLRDVPAPDPTGLPLDRYVAPERTLLYAPTRGCYWNQCSFCYYGLSETATASYREIPPARVAEDLAQLSQRFGVRHVYISCDVLAPAYAVRLAQAIVDRGLDITWSSDLKIEKYFTPKRCELLYRSGLRAAAFGIESGSDRILDLMRKGCDRATMTRVNRDFHEAGIATEWMTFTDHPGETLEEALATIAWIEEERERVALFVVGEFGLERGSAIYQDPSAFGVEAIWFAEGDDLRLYAQFKQAGGGRDPAQQEVVDAAISRLSRGYRLAAYPWAGANSTHHSLLWLLARGPGAFREQLDAPGLAARAVAEAVRAVRPKTRPRFSLARIADREDRFFASYWPRALYTTLPARRSGGARDALAPLSLPHFERESQRVPAMLPARRRL